MATVQTILNCVDRLAPFRLAEEWDNVGLLLGDAARPVRRLLVCLDVTEAVCDEAERTGAEVILAHHPLIFEGVRRLTADTPAGRLAVRLLGQGRAVIAAHTNLDSAQGGLCDILAGMLDLADLEPLQAAPAAKRFKVVVFVPEAHLDAVRAAAFGAGAGHIGRYSECGFAAAGTGTFLPGEGTQPALGEAGQPTRAAELRFETVVDADRLGAVVAAVARAHPYEEPAIDAYPLHAPPPGLGIGRVGRPKKSSTLAQLADNLKERAGLQTVGIAGRPECAPERVAVVTGAGSGLVEAVAAAGCQAYVTGELKYHEVLDLSARGIGLVLGGHYATERVPLDAWAPRLAETIDCEVLLSESEADPTRGR